MSINTRFFIAVSVVFLSTTFSMAEEKIRDGYPEPVRFVSKWTLNPVVPTGFTEIHRIKAKITDGKTPDIFILMTDLKTDQIVWFKKRGKYWNLSVIESVPTRKHTEYGIDIRKAKLFVNGKRLLYGIEGSEAISYFEWDKKHKIFIGYAI